MDDDSAEEAEKQIAAQRVRQKVAEGDAAFRSHLAPIQKRVFLTLKETYSKCANECYGGSRTQEEKNNCIQNCTIPLSNAKQAFDKEKGRFEANLARSLLMCKDKLEIQKKSGDTNYMVSCAEEAVQDSIRMLPIHANTLKTAFGIRDNRFK